MESTILEVLSGIFNYLIHTFAANWLILLFGILIAVAISVYIDVDKARKYFLNRPRFLTLSSVLFGAFTPLCACGTMAVVLSLVSSTIPWGAIMAFLVSSPLMSPDTFVMLSGFLGVNFTLALLISSIVLGLGAGWISHLLEVRTSFLNDQLRLNSKKALVKDKEYAKSSKQNVPLTQLEVVTLNYADGKTSCCDSEKVEVSCCGNSEFKDETNLCEKYQIKKFLKTFYELAIVKILPLFIVFVIIAYLVKEYVPTSWIVTLFSGEHFYSVPLAALIGLPMYVSDATVLPLLQVLRDAGASDGAILAYMIAGPATSLGVIGGLTMIMKRRAIILYVAIILVGAFLLGYTYDLVLAIT